MSGGRARLRAALLAAILTIGAARLAFAAPGRPVRIALLAATPDDPLAGRIEAELRALGFQVERSAISPDLPIDELVRQQIAGGARAAVVADGHRTDVWIAAADVDRVGLRQELEVEESAGLQSVLALRTVEFLRISLGLAAGPPAPEVTAAPPPPPSAARPVEHGVAVALDVSSGVLASTGGVGPFAIVGASLRARLWWLLGLEVCGYVPLNSAELSDMTGQARATVWLAGGGLLLAPRDSATRRLSGELGVGALAAVARAAGMAVPPGRGGTVEGVGAVLYGRAAGKIRLGGNWALRLDLLAGGAIRRPVIELTDSYPWGRPFLAALGGGEVQF
ncbi:MAG TPA: hypothetical protein VHM31_08305 [Polyangia bacterium]|nr:hypothetical protein [Polyangia bacterium]